MDSGVGAMLLRLKEWRWFKGHLLIYLSLMIAGLFLRTDEGGTAWFGIGWTIVVAVHFLIVKAMNVDEDWGEARAYKLRSKTYDHKHIDQIVDSAVDGDPAEDPSAPRRHL